MTVSSSVTLTVNGSNRTILTEALLEDIDANGVAWCEPVRRLSAVSDPVETLGVYMNIANIARAQERFADELGALRAARRANAVSWPEITGLIAERRAKCTFVVPTAADPYTIAAYEDNPALFDELLGGESLPCENLYYNAAPYRCLTAGGAPLISFDDKTDNLSFHVCHGNQRLATVPLAVQSDGIARWVPLVTNYAGIPARIHLRDDCYNPGKILNLILDYLAFLMRSYGLKEVLIQEPLPDRMLLYRLLGREGLFSAELWDRPVVDLGQTEDQIYSNVRASYKSQINWCRKHLAMQYYAGATLDEAKVTEVHQIVQRCHQKVIENRGDNMTPNSFLLAIEMCRRDKGEVAIARTSDGEACAIAVTTDDGDVAYYALGGQMQLGNRNPGNFILYDSIVRAKRRGMQRFQPNALAPAPAVREADKILVRPKWQVSNFFYKRGFSEDLDIVHVYRILPKTLSAFGPR